MGNRTELYSSDTLNDDGSETLNLTATTVGTKRGMDVSILGGGGTITDVNGAAVNWTTITVAQTSTTIETFTYSNTGGDLVVVTTTYTDATRNVLLTVVKTAP